MTNRDRFRLPSKTRLGSHSARVAGRVQPFRRPMPPPDERPDSPSPIRRGRGARRGPLPPAGLPALVCTASRRCLRPHVASAGDPLLERPRATGVHGEQTMPRVGGRRPPPHDGPGRIAADVPGARMRPSRGRRARARSARGWRPQRSRGSCPRPQPYARSPGFGSRHAPGNEPPALRPSACSSSLSRA